MYKANILVRRDLSHFRNHPFLPKADKWHTWSAQAASIWQLAVEKFLWQYRPMDVYIEVKVCSGSQPRSFGVFFESTEGPFAALGADFIDSLSKLVKRADDYGWRAVKDFFAAKCGNQFV